VHNWGASRKTVRKIGSSRSIAYREKNKVENKVGEESKQKGRMKS